MLFQAAATGSGAHRCAHLQGTEGLTVCESHACPHSFTVPSPNVPVCAGSQLYGSPGWWKWPAVLNATPAMPLSLIMSFGTLLHFRGVMVLTDVEFRLFFLELEWRRTAMGRGVER